MSIQVNYTFSLEHVRCAMYGQSLHFVTGKEELCSWLALPGLPC